MEAVTDATDPGRYLSGAVAERRVEAPLGQILMQRRLIEPAQLERALALQARDRSRHLGRILIELGSVMPEQVNDALATQCGIPRVRLDPLDVPRAVLAAIPSELALRHEVLPIARAGGRLMVAMKNPFDTALIDLLRFNSGLDVVPAIAAADDLAQAHTRHYSRIDEDAVQGAVVEAGRSGAAAEQGAGDPVAGEREANRRPIVRLLDSILLQGVRLRASDINIRPEEGRIAIYYRIDGRLRHDRSLKGSLLPALASRIKIVGQMNIAERRLPQEGAARIAWQGRDIDLRISVVPTVHGESVVVRILDRQAGLKPLSELGLLPADEARLRRILRSPNGLCLVTGPTGSGKSTTLYAMLNEVRQDGAHVLTVEDPVEYRMSGVEQVQVAERIGYDFPEVLRRFLRHDPDVIMVGEIRDGATAGIACRAALTGHFVMSSLHTNDAPGAVTRLIDMGVERYVIASTLRGVLAQRLLRLACRSCAGKGCGACAGTGYAGRRVVCEVMAVSPDLAALIARGAAAEELAELACSEGMTRIADHARALMSEGATTADEAASVGG